MSNPKVNPAQVNPGTGTSVPPRNLSGAQKGLILTALIVTCSSIAFGTLSLLVTYHYIVVSPLAYYTFTALAGGSGLTLVGSIAALLYINPVSPSKSRKVQGSNLVGSPSAPLQTNGVPRPSSQIASQRQNCQNCIEFPTNMPLSTVIFAKLEWPDKKNVTQKEFSLYQDEGVFYWAAPNRLEAGKAQTWLQYYPQDNEWYTAGPAGPDNSHKKVANVPKMIEYSSGFIPKTFPAYIPANCSELSKQLYEDLRQRTAPQDMIVLYVSYQWSNEVQSVNFGFDGAAWEAPFFDSDNNFIKKISFDKSGYFVDSSMNSQRLNWNIWGYEIRPQK